MQYYKHHATSPFMYKYSRQDPVLKDLQSIRIVFFPRWRQSKCHFSTKWEFIVGLM
jgi:hypothetical protein